jgi:hypothetical protein
MFEHPTFVQVAISLRDIHPRVSDLVNSQRALGAARKLQDALSTYLPKQ